MPLFCFGDASPVTFDIKPAGHALPYGCAPFPFVTVDGSGALAALAELRQTWQDATPVIWGNGEQAARLFELYDEEDAATPEAILSRAEGKTANELIDEHKAAARASLAAWYAKRGETVREVEDREAPHGAWPDDVLPYQVPFSLFDSSTGRPQREVLIGLVPTARNWEIPAFHRFGSWNDCPSPEIHVAIAREWADRYGARLIINTGDVIEFEIDAPIASREEAMAVAELQFKYCSDIVDQGTQTIEFLAASLIGAKYWFFWWD